MKRYIVYTIMLAIFMQIIDIITFANTNITTAQESLNLANEWLGENIGYYNFFGETNINGDGINEVLAIKGTPAFSNMPIFVYGSEEKASIDAVKKAANKVIKRPDKEGVPQYRCLGYTINGDLFANPVFPPDFPPTQNIKTLNGRWVKDPWNHSHPYIR